MPTETLDEQDRQILEQISTQLARHRRLVEQSELATALMRQRRDNLRNTYERKLEEHDTQWRELGLLFGIDIADGEGTTPAEMVEMVRRNIEELKAQNHANPNPS